MLRKALGKAPNGRGFIETLPKRGYRFAADVKRARFDVPGGGIDRAMLVVLSFENLIAGDRYDYFSDGLTEEMITEVGSIPIARCTPNSAERSPAVRRQLTFCYLSVTEQL
jgi:hypothetical protein